MPLPTKHLSPSMGESEGAIMIIIWKDPNMRLHGKMHKRDPYYFRHHYGKQRLVYIQKEYIDRPTANQQASREAFKALRQEVARQLHDPQLKARWEARFKQDNQGYKFLHTYVYAQLKAGITVETPSHGVSLKAPVTPVVSVFPSAVQLPPSTGGLKGGFILYNGTITPIFLPSKVPKKVCLQI